VNRHKNIKWRKMPICNWCFLPVPATNKKFCSDFCMDAAQAWINERHWQKIGQDFQKKAKQEHFEKTILGEEDYESSVEGDGRIEIT